MHTYNFLIDGKWRHNPDDALTTDESGHVMNVLVVRGSGPSPGRGTDTQDIPLYVLSSSDRSSMITAHISASLEYQRLFKDQSALKELRCALELDPCSPSTLFGELPHEFHHMS